MGNGRIVMLVDNGVEGDSRVQKTALSAAEAGWEVTLLGCSSTGAEQRRRLGPAKVRLLPLGGGAATTGNGLRGRLLARGGRSLRLARLARRPVEHAQVWFWREVQGDRSWRRLEPGLWNYERAFGPAIDELAPDLIHAHDVRMLGVGARAAQRARDTGRTVKLVWDAHEFLPGARPRRDNARWLPAHMAYEREYAPSADAVVTVSDTLAGMLQREHHLPGRPLVVLNAPAAAADDEVPDLRRLCGIGPETPLLVYSGSSARNEPDLDLFDSPLPRSLANTKLFRRELLERHHIRYLEDMPIGSDLPFTLEACYRAGRISVLADYEFYYAVRRLNATNITYLSRHLLRLRTVQKVMAFVAGLIPPGRQRDAILLRRFDHEIARLVEDDFLRLDPETQRVVHDGIGRLVADL